jgi:hypothetical protein
METEWRKIPGCPIEFEVNRMGDIRTIDRIVIDSMGRSRRWPSLVRKPQRTPLGYCYFSRRDHGRGANAMKNFSVHRAVALAFIPNPENKREVNHIDGNPSNNRVENLEWVTPSENNKHSYDFLGRKAHPNPGIKNGNALLTEEDVVFIRKNHGLIPFKKMAAMIGVRKCCVEDVAYGKSWKHVTVA